MWKIKSKVVPVFTAALGAAVAAAGSRHRTSLHRRVGTVQNHQTPASRGTELEDHKHKLQGGKESL